MHVHKILYLYGQKRGDKMSPRTGRPTDNPKKVRLEIRLTEEQSKMLTECAKDLDLTKTDVVVKGIENIHQLLGRTNRKK